VCHRPQSYGNEEELGALFQALWPSASSSPPPGMPARDEVFITGKVRPFEADRR